MKRYEKLEPMKTRHWVLIGDPYSIPPKECRRVRYGDYEIALFNLGGEFRATDGHCPHKQGPLADGIIAGEAVFCPLHNWKISLETGCALTGGVGKVKVYPVKVAASKIYVAFEEGACREPKDNPAVPGPIDLGVKDVGG